MEWRSRASRSRKSRWGRRGASPRPSVESGSRTTRALGRFDAVVSLGCRARRSAPPPDLLRRPAVLADDGSSSCTRSARRRRRRRGPWIEKYIFPETTPSLAQIAAREGSSSWRTSTLGAHYDRTLMLGATSSAPGGDRGAVRERFLRMCASTPPAPARSGRASPALPARPLASGVRAAGTRALKRCPEGVCKLRASRDFGTST